MENSNYKILLVDDEPDILEFIGYNLRKEGYIVLTSSNGKDSIKVAKKEIPHLIILDVMMPEMDGIETCIELRKIPELNNTVITFLTARSEDYSLIAGLDAGADDYITKPIKPRVLISKIKSLFRRNIVQATERNKESYEIGDLVINREKFIVTKNDQEITLTKKEFELLELLTSRPNKVFTREEIFSTVWDSDVIVGDRTIDVHIRKLREKIGFDSITTIKGVGYKFDI